MGHVSRQLGGHLFKKKKLFTEVIRLLSTVEKDFGGPTRLSKDFIDLDTYLRSPKVFTVLTTPLTGALGRRITNHHIFGKRKILNFFLLFFILIFFLQMDH